MRRRCFEHRATRRWAILGMLCTPYGDRATTKQVRQPEIWPLLGAIHRSPVQFGLGAVPPLPPRPKMTPTEQQCQEPGAGPALGGEGRMQWHCLAGIRL